MQEELNQFERKDIWELVPCPPSQTIIGTKWVFRNKLDDQGNIVRTKARLVAQGYCHEEGIDYDETFAPIARLEAIRILLAYSCFKNFKHYQIHVKSAFLNGFIQEEKWQDCLLVQIYVDDIIFCATNESLCKKFSKLMQGEFEMSMIGELNFFLELQIKQCQEGIYISQSNYTKELPKKFGIEEGRTVTTPMETNVKLDKDEKVKSVDESKYRGMIGSLLYSTASRPDILHVVCLCACFQSNHKESNMSVVKRIFRYLKGTISYGLFYPKNENFSLKGYSDSDYAENIDDRKSTSGSCRVFGDCLVSWFLKKQNCVSLSTAEAEYISAAFCCTQLLWMKQTLADYKCSFENIPIFCDNTSAINITQNPVHHNRTKHIEFRHHFLRDCVSKRKIEMCFVPSQDQLVDIFTKPLTAKSFASIQARLGIMHIE
ncbi:hypothetical protein DH2020_045715 [Rehmannia glutinosa]|uniref:Reverse transcriptase Ty1/copia-type domain-containing protein n=1 Tax=Rehmannia glutinosa TaxID=99300 RepID=A0ABR0UDE7_REHGL